MKLNKVESYSRYLEIVEQYGPKGCTTNDYIQREAETLVAEGKLFEYCNEKNAFLLVKKDVCYRVYYYINDFGELHDFSGEDLVVEILYRGESFYPTAVVDYLERCGFSVNLVRDQYAGVYKDLQISTHVGDLKIEAAQNIEEVGKACELFNESFDHFSGDYIPSTEYPSLLDNKRILIAKDLSGTFLGALHQTIENRVAWISHVAVLPEARGKHVGLGLAETYIQNNHVDEKSRYMLWVQHQNVAAVSMYQKLGFRYLGKSTLSMIKNK